MPLPPITIPEIPIPLEIPELLHPAIVHFIIAIPIIILLLEIYNLIVKRPSISVFSLLMLIVVAVAIFASYLTGTVDGKSAWDALGAEGQSELKEHKLLGMYLVYASLGLVVLKILFMAIGKTFGRVLFILILGGFIAVTLFQGKEGGELVYKYGANVEAVSNIKSDLEDAIEERDELQEKIDDKKSEVAKAPETTETTKLESEPVKEEETSKEVESKNDNENNTTTLTDNNNS